MRGTVDRDAIRQHGINDSKSMGMVPDLSLLCNVCHEQHWIRRDSLAQQHRANIHFSNDVNRKCDISISFHWQFNNGDIRSTQKEFRIPKQATTDH